MHVGRLERAWLLWSGAPIVLVGRPVALWATVGMIAASALLRRSGRVAHGELGRMRGRGSARERAEACHWTLSKVVGVRGAAVASSLTSHWGHLGHLMRLVLCVEHHLLVRPLGELGVGWVVIGHLSLLRVGWMAVHGVGLLMGILIEGRVELLGRRRPCRLLLLLDGVGIRLLL